MPSFYYMSFEDLAADLCWLSQFYSVLHCKHSKCSLFTQKKCTFSCHQGLLISSYTLVPINHPNRSGQTVFLSHSGLTSFQHSTAPHFPLKPWSSYIFFSLRHLWSFQTEPYETWDRSLQSQKTISIPHQGMFRGSASPAILVLGSSKPGDQELNSSSCRSQRVENTRRTWPTESTKQTLKKK